MAGNFLKLAQGICEKLELLPLLCKTVLKVAANSIRPRRRTNIMKTERKK